MIELMINENNLKQAVERCRQKNIIIPTFKQMKDPGFIPDRIKDELTKIGLWEIHPRNLFRITWKNEPVGRGGGFGDVNYMVVGSEISGIKARIIALVGKWFPTGSHKVGATFGCLVPSLVTGQFNPAIHKAVWPSTGNYCRGGAYNATLLGCRSVAILPEEMSRERFEWLSKVAGEVIATPGCESNVKEIFDKCKELKSTRDDVVIFNQFDEFGNHLWHYEVTGRAMEEVLGKQLKQGQRLAGVVLTSGSSGTLGCADYLKEIHPDVKVCVGEAIQCPTLILNGYGGHRIEGIGDKHVPWIHNVRNTDMVIGIDDEDCIRIMRLFNEPCGIEVLVKNGVSEEVAKNLGLLGISSIANVIASIKFAKYYELGQDDVILTVFTDSMELYQSRIKQYRQERGEYDYSCAEKDLMVLRELKIDNVKELTYYDKKRIHNLKYFTWIEQQGRQIQELDRQWYDYRNYWSEIHSKTEQIDLLIEEFNSRVGLI